MQLDVINIKGEKVGQIDLADNVFSTEVKSHLLWEVVKAQQAAKRAGTHSTKNRDEVRGGGRKPYKQKGTGNARQGSTRSPNFVGGGKVFGPHPRSYEYTVPKKVRRQALASALTLKAIEKKIVIVDELNLTTPKSKTMAEFLKKIGYESAVVIESKSNVNLCKSVKNLQTAICLPPEGLNVFDILKYNGLVISKAVLKNVEARVENN
jgi:large subunit ribosomal protein L4